MENMHAYNLKYINSNILTGTHFSFEEIPESISSREALIQFYKKNRHLAMLLLYFVVLDCYTIMSKLFEIVILNRYGDLLHLTDNQFGYKKKHATDLCVYTLKGVVDYYRSNSSPVYICFLDASKAFDRVNYAILCKKLARIICQMLLCIFCMYGFLDSVFM